MAGPVRAILWTHEARNDLKDALAWLRTRNRIAAARMEQDILDLVAAAAKRPEAGRQGQIEQVRLRSLPRWHRRLAYQLRDDSILILSIKDTRQEPTNP